MTTPKKSKVTKAIAKRPAEALTGPALGFAVYGFATQVGVPQIVAGLFAVICAFGPVTVSAVVDLLKD